MKTFAMMLTMCLALLLTVQESANSQSNNGNRNVTLDTSVSKRFVVEQLGDVSCNFIVEIDPSRQSDPVIRQETTCNNLLQFVSNTDIEVTISKNDGTPGDTSPGELAILDALGVMIDRNTVPNAGNNYFGTGCTFYNSSGNEYALPNGLDTVLTAELDDIWYDPQTDGDVVAGDGNFFNSQTVILNLPVDHTGIYDCRFKLEFFLSTDDFHLLPAGEFNFTMEFTSAAAPGFEGI